MLFKLEVLKTAPCLYQSHCDLFLLLRWLIDAACTDTVLWLHRQILCFRFLFQVVRTVSRFVLPNLLIRDGSAYPIWFNIDS